MDIENKLKELVNQLFINTGASFSGIFIEGKDVISKTIYPEKGENLQEIMGLIINKAHQINEFIPDFGEEYVYAEGPEISIFIYFVRQDIAIGSIIEEKPKFALLKFEHSVLSNKIKEIQDEIDKYILGTPLTEKTEETQETVEETPEEYPEKQPEFEEIQLESLEHAVPQLREQEEEKEPPKEEEKTDITVEDVKDRFAEELEMLEKTQELEEFEEKQQTQKEQIQYEPEQITEENPSLEEILKPAEDEQPQTIEEELEKISEEQEFYDPDVLNKIREELLKEIGPVGKFLFKKKLKDLNIDEDRITRNVLVKLIDELSNDIIDEKRKKRFVDRVSAFL
ncbi:hypothetical protein [Persephonella sp.]|uniref:hypothetical protein n=1 Tax=Persephonella sp. TaxID=2060922 RepID=UPI00260137B8|nr:hypothetical protein [Persephonella sp.]